MMLPPMPPLHSVAISTPPTMLNPTACPALLMPRASLNMAPGSAPRLMILPPLHSVAKVLLPWLNPTACPALFMLMALLLAVPGRTPG
jgi:hypothetical protein